MLDMIDIRSSWLIDATGHSTRIDAPAEPPDRREGNAGYRCSNCGERGHSRRTCGRDPVR